MAKLIGGPAANISFAQAQLLATWIIAKSRTGTKEARKKDQSRQAGGGRQQPLLSPPPHPLAPQLPSLELHRVELAIGFGEVLVQDGVVAAVENVAHHLIKQIG